MKIIQRIGVLLLLLVFLFGTFGISVFHHRCNSSNEDNTSVYPELFTKAGSSCCVDEETGYVCSGHETAPEDIYHQKVDAAPCCKSTFSFFKLEIITERAEKFVLNTENSQLPLYPAFLPEEPKLEQPVLTPAHFQFYSPPLFGKVLVYFLNQIKIPAFYAIA